MVSSHAGREGIIIVVILVTDVAIRLLAEPTVYSLDHCLMSQCGHNCRL